MAFKFAEPVTHELGAFAHFTDLNLYFATVNYSMYEVKEAYNHNITIGHRTFKFFSKPGGFINPKTGKVAFEYILSWQDAVGASKCTYSIKPMFGQGTETKKGKFSRIAAVGTQIQIQSSFIELDEHMDIIFEFLDHIEASRFKQCFDPKQSTVYQGARHIRYHEQHERDVAELLQVIERESTMLNGDSDLVKRMRSGMYEMYKIDNPNFEICKINTKYEHGVKTYRIENFRKRAHEDPLRHPKLEVFMKSNPGENPTFTEYLQLKKDLDHVLISLLSFVSPIEYVSDDYFDADRIFEYRYDLPKWNYKTVPETTFSISDEMDSIRKPLQVLAYIALQKEGCAKFRDIEEATGIPERSLYRYVNMWKAEGILESARKEVSYVYFRTKALWEDAKPRLVDICAMFNFGFKKVFGELFVDSGVIRQFRERGKNLKKVTGYRRPTKQHFIVDSYHEGKSLAKELKELGINFSMGVRSSKNNLPYSRVM
jgi:DNA-binding Lrp family transcriptional regulator